MENRLRRRYEAALPIRIHSAELPTVDGVTTDISICGLQFTTSQRYRRNERLTLEVQAGSHHIECVGRVTRMIRAAKGRYLCSVWFSSFTGKSRSTLSSLLMDRYLQEILEERSCNQTLELV